MEIVSHQLGYISAELIIPPMTLNTLIYFEIGVLSGLSG
jgi:hypothetical protein